MGRHIVIRTDASTTIGSGHVMRCLTIAEELRDAGSEVLFVSRAHPGNLNGLIRNKGFQCHELPESPARMQASRKTQDSRSEYASWLGVSQQRDAEETIEVIGDDRPDWLIVDHYGLDEEWETLLRPYISKIMVIDDLADRRHDCDLLLDQNFFTDGQKRYDDLVPPSCTKLLGPKYALLRREFREVRKNLRERTGEVERVLVFMGGSDPDNVTGKAIEALSDPGLLHLQVDVVIGAQNPKRETVEKLVKDRPGTTLHVQTSNMAELMCKADLAIGAGGSATWERCCMGLPTIIIPIANNQIPIAKGVQEAGCGISCQERVKSSNLAKEIHHVIDRNIIKEISGKALSITDGAGAEKIRYYIGDILTKAQKKNHIKNKNYTIYFTSDEGSWINPFIDKLIEELKPRGHKIHKIHNSTQLGVGDFNFILSYSKVIDAKCLGKNKHNLVVHESDLPEGKGWSPLTWQILEGKNNIPICLFEADEDVDSGEIYIKRNMKFSGSELLDELHIQQGETTIEMCRQFIEEYPEILNTAVQQTGKETFYSKRTPEDSRLDPTKTIREQFNLLRIVDNEKYPAYFQINNHRYELTIRKSAR